MTNQEMYDKRKSLEYPEAVEHRKQIWGSNRPIDMLVIEYCGDGDPFFGGDADDRVLCTDGKFHKPHQCNKAAIFTTIEQAHEAIKTASIFRRSNSIVGVLPRWR